MKSMVATLGIIAASFLYAGMAFGDAAVGIILDGQKGNCSVKKKNGAVMKCRSGMQLDIGDEVTRTPDVKSIKVQWFAPALIHAVETGKTSFRVTAAPPPDKNDIASVSQTTIPFLKKLPLSRQSEASCIQNPLPTPGYSVTLLPLENTVFSWPVSGKTFIIADSKKYQVVRVPLAGERSLRLTPERIGMQPGQKYSWYIEGVDTDEFFDIRLLGTTYVSLVRDGFAVIDKTSRDPEERAVRKAAYVQLLSDLYPKEVDLYWLSAQLIENVTHDAVSGLRLRFAQHLLRTVQFQ